MICAILEWTVYERKKKKMLVGKVILSGSRTQYIRITLFSFHNYSNIIQDQVIHIGPMYK